MSNARFTGMRFLLILLAGCVVDSWGQAGPIREGFDAGALPATDDGSSDAVSLGFSVNFFGQTFSSIFVNNNGNLSFSAPLAHFTPVPLGELPAAVIAPFFADVDTTISGTVRYGTGQASGRNAFAATWNDVGYYDSRSDKTNSFQAILIDRSDLGAGDFDLEYNYGQLQWETGEFSGGIDGLGGSSARVGYTAGTQDPGTYHELPGSAVPGALIDSSPAETALALQALGSDISGRTVFESREGVMMIENVMPTPPTTNPPGGNPRPGTDGGGVIGTPEPETIFLSVFGISGLAAWQLKRNWLVSMG